jgi:hypothetical protein
MTMTLGIRMGSPMGPVSFVRGFSGCSSSGSESRSMGTIVGIGGRSTALRNGSGGADVLRDG